MPYLKSSDFNIVKIRQYADKRLMKDFWSEKCQKQHQERAHNYLDFKYSFIEKLTGKTVKQWREEDFEKYFESDFILKELEKTYNVYVRRWTDDSLYYYIPKNNPELFEWVMNNLPNNPHKIMKRSYTIYVHEN